MGLMDGCIDEWMDRQTQKSFKNIAIGKYYFC